MNREEEEEQEETASNGRKILHIFSKFKEPTREIEVEDYHSVPNTEINPEHKVNIKFSMKSKLLKLDSTSRKHPRSIREHTYFKKCPCTLTCPNCLSYIESDVWHYSTRVTHIIAASLLPIGMCILPYCTTVFRDAAHYCPRCQIYLGTNFGAGREVFSFCVKHDECNGEAE